MRLDSWFGSGNETNSCKVKGLACETRAAALCLLYFFEIINRRVGQPLAKPGPVGIWRCPNPGRTVANLQQSLFH